MLFDSSYTEILSPSTGIYKEKGSKFISYAFPVKTEEEIKLKIEEIKKKEHAARHYCYAYVLSSDKSNWRTNDDGEPSNTAGKPIIGQIHSKNLTNILIVVVRYFGGIKLGISGLIRSYKNSAFNAIENAKMINKKIEEFYQVFYKYENTNHVMRIIKEFKLKIIKQTHHNKCSITFKVERHISQKIINKLEENHHISVKYLKTT